MAPLFCSSAAAKISLRVVRRIVDRGDAVGEIGEVDPVLLGDQPVAALGTVPVGVDESGDEGLPGNVDDLGAGRETGAPAPDARPDGDDPVALDDDDAVLDDLVRRAVRGAAQGDDPATDQGDRARGPGVRHIEAEPHAGRRRLRELLGCAGHEGEGLFEIPREELRPQRPVETPRIAGPVQPLTGILRHPRDRHGARFRTDFDRLAGRYEWRHEDVPALGEGEPPAVRGEAELGRGLGGRVGAQIGARESDRHQRALVLVAVAASGRPARPWRRTAAARRRR